MRTLFYYRKHPSKDLLVFDDRLPSEEQWGRSFCHHCNTALGKLANSSRCYLNSAFQPCKNISLIIYQKPLKTNVPRFLSTLMTTFWWHWKSLSSSTTRILFQPCPPRPSRPIFWVLMLKKTLSMFGLSENCNLKFEVFFYFRANLSLQNETFNVLSLFFRRFIPVHVFNLPKWQNFYFLQNLAKFLQVEKILQDSYKNFISCKILGCNGILAKFLQESCKIS